MLPSPLAIERQARITLAAPESGEVSCGFETEADVGACNDDDLILEVGGWISEGGELGHDEAKVWHFDNIYDLM